MTQTGAHEPERNPRTSEIATRWGRVVFRGAACRPDELSGQEYQGFASIINPI